ncbi:PepSY-like domain-containing protein [Daejeonella sp.]|uniref:PepSY-like domain-containing protein n=1 Tax=Daejeonella sp. TaxID=2805397 RepID=UPI0030C13177
MKKIFFVVMAFVCAYTTTFAQSKTPKAVTTAFNQKFPNASNVKWDKENAHEYEASFDWKGQKHSANFNDTGEWLETESPITFNQLPEKVKKAFNASHKGKITKTVAKIETSKGQTQYEVEVKQGLKTVEFFYNANGSIIKE